VFTSADLIEALRRRARRSLRPDSEPGEFPPGWQNWLDTMSARFGAVTGAAAEAFVALFLEREPALPPPRMLALTRWQAFATLWRQQWQPPAPEERRMRLLAMTITLVIHFVLLVLLLWIAYVRFTGAPPPPGEEVVQVEFIGRGTPQEQGGAPPGPQAQPQPRTVRTTPAPTQAAARSRPAAAPIVQPAPLTSPPEQVASTATPAPAPATPSQPLQVSNVPEPTTEFVLPPPSVRTAEVPQLQAPALQVAPRELPMIERAQPVEAARPQVAIGQLHAPVLQPEVAPTLPEVQARNAEVPTLRTPTLQAPAREIPLSEAAETTATAAQPAAPAATQAPTASSAQATTPAANAAPATPAAPLRGPGTRSGTTPGAKATAGAGPGAAKPGAWPTPLPNDEWGASNRNRPGANAGTPGVAGEPGRPGLPPGWTGAPPGSVTQHVDLDRAGTWLKRPPVNYTPTRFDKFWTPSETLLEEWVRKNIRSVEIPIPGSSKRLHCVVSILQLGGGCGIEDPNMQDQEAEARKPPDVPFKPDLQEDQQSLYKSATP
jgi:hypothetical protein